MFLELVLVANVAAKAFDYSIHIVSGSVGEFSFRALLFLVKAAVQVGERRTGVDAATKIKTLQTGLSINRTKLAFIVESGAQFKELSGVVL